MPDKATRLELPHTGEARLWQGLAIRFVETLDGKTAVLVERVRRSVKVRRKRRFDRNKPGDVD